MSSIKKFAVLSMLVVVALAFSVPASAAIGTGIGAATAAATGISSAAITSTSSAAGFGAFGGFGFPFNWGFSQFGIGAFPYNWGLGAGFGTFGLGWNKFSPCFGSGSFFSPCFLGSCYQGLPFILGTMGGCAGPGYNVAPWAFGLGGCVKSLPLYFGAHGFGFPFTFPGFGASLIPPVGGLIPAAIPAALSATSVCQGLPFILGTMGGCAGPGYNVAPWAFGLGGCVKSLPLYFGAHGFGFPFTFPGFGASLIPPATLC